MKSFVDLLEKNPIFAILAFFILITLIISGKCDKKQAVDVGSPATIVL